MPVVAAVFVGSRGHDRLLLHAGEELMAAVRAAAREAWLSLCSALKLLSSMAAATVLSERPIGTLALHLFGAHANRRSQAQVRWFSSQVPSGQTSLRGTRPARLVAAAASVLGRGRGGEVFSLP